MARADGFSAADTIELENHGLNLDEAERQFRLFEKSPPHVQLDRPCTIGDGIRALSDAEVEAASAEHAEASHQGRLMKFVPASGAATRMCQALLAERDRAGSRSREDALQRRAAGDTNAATVLTFMDAIDRFAFSDHLRAGMAAHGWDTAALLRQGDFGKILDGLFSPEGLNASALPKGLLPFHRYPEGNRTAFEEHLVEAAETVADRHGTCRVHFTVSPEHEDRFRKLLGEVRDGIERRHDIRLEVGFSIQKRSTDTVAVDLHNRPFRTDRGTLLFRPGGHGALIENLYDLGGDIVFIKNIDNVVPDWLRADTLRWKKILAGLLVIIQRNIFDHLARLRGRSEPAVVDTALRFAREDLGLSVPARFESSGVAEQQQRLIEALDRPVRVCGVVRNTGEPGGGPFWVRGRDGSLSLQIVESAEVDPARPEQEAIFRAATHFNPVDLVVGVRNQRGDRFDLRRFVDSEAVFIAHKSMDGRDLKALERPGLWNGAMAHWTTVFVEVPGSTFTPVKTVLDLLGPEHQPRAPHG
ncbi:MAG TPA: DUF4301 family protein [Solirubrobacteraceae bacterium]|nr:DUF4301 family protein [Solirubrobacteraceae bacterium]